MSDTELAKARARLLLQLGGGTASRVTARRVTADIKDNLNDPECARTVRIASDDVQCDRMKLSAAALINGNDIAASVSAQDRAALSKLIDNEIRGFALSARRLAGPARGDKGQDCATNIQATLSDVGTAWAELCPFMETPAEPAQDSERLKAAVALAIDHVSASHG